MAHTLPGRTGALARFQDEGRLIRDRRDPTSSGRRAPISSSLPCTSWPTVTVSAVLVVLTEIVTVGRPVCLAVAGRGEAVDLDRRRPGRS